MEDATLHNRNKLVRTVLRRKLVLTHSHKETLACVKQLKRIMLSPLSLIYKERHR